MSKSVVSISHNSRVKICHRVPGSECESSLSWIKGEGSEDQTRWVEVLDDDQKPGVKIHQRKSKSECEDTKLPGEDPLTMSKSVVSLARSRGKGSLDQSRSVGYGSSASEKWRLADAVHSRTVGVR